MWGLETIKQLNQSGYASAYQAYDDCNIKTLSNTTKEGFRPVQQNDSESRDQIPATVQEAWSR